MSVTCIHAYHGGQDASGAQRCLSSGVGCATDQCRCGSLLNAGECRGVDGSRTCDSDSECASGYCDLSASPGPEQGRCCAGGQCCDADSDCGGASLCEPAEFRCYDACTDDAGCLPGWYCYRASQRCYDGVLGDRCDSLDDCNGGLVCRSTTCLLDLGQLCAADEQCASAACECEDEPCVLRRCADADCVCGWGAAGSCGSPIGFGVRDPEDCSSNGTGCSGGNCACDGLGTGPAHCVLALGQACLADEHCLGRQCECADASCGLRVCAATDCDCGWGANGLCTSVLAAGEDPQDCEAGGVGCAASACACDGLGKDADHCLTAAGAACDGDSDCLSGRCECASADCTSSRCAAVRCPCAYNLNGDDLCDGLLADAALDPGYCDEVDRGCYAGACLLRAGARCDADSECGDGQCECSTASCDQRVCHDADCTCGWGTSGACAHALAAGLLDPEDCGPGLGCIGSDCRCDGTGACDCADPEDCLVTWFGVGASEVTPWPHYAQRSDRGGGVSGTVAGVVFSSLATDAAGLPAVTWFESASGVNQVYVRRWDGQSWVELAGSASGAGASASPSGAQHGSVAIDSQGRVVLAWQDSRPGNEEIYVRRFEGGSWRELAGSASAGGISATATLSERPEVAIEPASDQPVVVWAEGVTPNQIYLRRYDGSAWVELAGSASGNGLSQCTYTCRVPHLRLSGPSNVLVSYRHNNGAAYDAYLKRFNGTAWVALAGSASGDGVSGSATGNVISQALAIDTAGDPVMAWMDDRVTFSQYEIYVRRYNHSSGAWIGYAGSDSGNGISNSSGIARYPMIACDGSGYPVVVWQDTASGANRVYLKRYNGSAWEALSGSATALGLSPGVGTGEWPIVALDSAGRPVVAYNDASPTDAKELFLTAWDGASWTGLGRGEGAGLGGTSGHARTPALALGSDLRPVLAWSDESSGNAEIYLRRFDGTEWSALAGSASGPGLSATVNASTLPSVALDRAGQPWVAWQEVVAGTPKVWLRRYSGTWSGLSGSDTGNGVGGTIGSAQRPRLLLDPADHPLVVYDDTPTGGAQVYLRYHNGTAWGGLGGSDSGTGVSQSSGAATAAAMALDSDGLPIVVWEDDAPGHRAIYARRYTGSAWVSLASSTSGDGVSGTSGTASSPSVAVAGDGTAYVAWSDSSSGTEAIYLRRYAAGAWGELAGSASGAGLAATTGSAVTPSVMLDRGGRPLVFWRERVDLRWELRGRRFQGGAWRDLGGSTSSGGVTRSLASPYDLSGAHHGVRLCLAWAEMGRRAQSIYLRCAEP